jgi:hypothetical protein
VPSNIVHLVTPSAQARARSKGRSLVWRLLLLGSPCSLFDAVSTLSEEVFVIVQYAVQEGSKTFADPNA